MRPWTQRAMYYPLTVWFEIACADEATRLCRTLAECAGPYPRLIADAYLMGGEL